MSNFITMQVPAHYEYLAPELSEIRLLPALKGGGVCHCKLPSGGASRQS